MSKITKTITIECSYCHKELVKDMDDYKGAKSRGQHNFYHRECYVKVKRPIFYRHKSPITLSYGIFGEGRRSR